LAFDCASDTLRRELTCRGKYGLESGNGANEGGIESEESGIDDKFVRVLIVDFQLL
jgi:hypothetical protein